MKNESAFPKTSYGTGFPAEGNEGMSLREYFAAKAMQSLIIVRESRPGPKIRDHSGGHRKCLDLAYDAFFYADKMMEVREDEKR